MYSLTREGDEKLPWLKPELVAQIEFEWTPDGHLRNPSVAGLRTNKESLCVHCGTAGLRGWLQAGGAAFARCGL
jgi:ATP dependent DNA ligase C terminal region